MQKRGRGGRERGQKREGESRSDMFAIIRNFMISVSRTGTFLVYVYIYIYIYRERERQRERDISIANSEHNGSIVCLLATSTI